MMKKVLLFISACLFLIACSDKESVARPKEICHKETYCAEQSHGGFSAGRCLREATRDVCEEIRY